jgi:hypothetical protein
MAPSSYQNQVNDGERMPKGTCRHLDLIEEFSYVSGVRRVRELLQLAARK